MAIVSIFAGGFDANAQDPSDKIATNQRVIIVHPAGQTNTAGDNAITTKIAERLQSDQLVSSHDVHAEVVNGVVTLGGKVETLLARDRAAQVAQTIPGVQQVQNAIQVAVPGRANWEVEADLQTAFRRNPALNTDTLNATCREGSVTLTGVVNSKHRKILAETLAKAVRGVARVENEIVVDVKQARTDNDLQMDLLSAIYWDPALENPQVAVNVVNGRASVTGVVANALAKERIVKDAELLDIPLLDSTGLRVEPRVVNKPGSPLDPASQKLTPTGRK